MFGLFKRSCSHKYVPFKEVRHTWIEDGSYYYTEIWLQCEKCGEIKTVNNKPWFF